ncbi:MAG: MarR family transcriptional regulator [Eubacteriales bacterium]|nr:MarR family transcriptional regulator [Eubacteriales bacterium]
MKELFALEGMAGHRPDVGFLLKVIHDNVRADADANLRKHDLTLSQMRVLTYLAHRKHEPVAQKDMEETFHVSRPTMVGILHRLESKGFIEYNVNPTDRRQRNVRITRCGWEISQALREHPRKIEERLLKGMSEEEMQTLTALLIRVYDNLQQTSDA